MHLNLKNILVKIPGYSIHFPKKIKFQDLLLKFSNSMIFQLFPGLVATLNYLKNKTELISSQLKLKTSLSYPE